MTPPERRALKTNRSLRWSSAHHLSPSRQRSRILTTCCFLQEHLLPLRSLTSSIRPPKFLSSMGSSKACVASPVRPFNSDARKSQGASRRCSMTECFETLVANRASSNPSGLVEYLCMLGTSIASKAPPLHLTEKPALTNPGVENPHPAGYNLRQGT